MCYQPQEQNDRIQYFLSQCRRVEYSDPNFGPWLQEYMRQEHGGRSRFRSGRGHEYWLLPLRAHDDDEISAITRERDYVYLNWCYDEHSVIAIFPKRSAGQQRAKMSDPRTRLQKGQVVVVSFHKTDANKGIICKVPGYSHAYLPANALLGADDAAKQLRLTAIGQELSPSDHQPIYARVTKTGYKFVHGKKRQRTTLAEITEAEYENQVHAAEECVLFIPKGSLQGVTVVRPAFKRGKKNEGCGLKVAFNSLSHPGVEALLHVSEIEGGAERVAEAQEGDALKVLVTRATVVNGQALFRVSETEITEKYWQAHESMRAQGLL
jgi:hypothetical protein